MTESENFADLQLPVASVARLIKEALPENAVAKQEAKLAIARAASVFVLFLTTATTDVTSNAKQKTMSANHVLSALKEIEFESFIPELETSLESYRSTMKNKKEKKLNDSTANKTSEKPTEDNADDDIEDD